jgi:hypothetical protein
MPTFTTSIKLLSATEFDYRKLSQEMEKKSFHPAKAQYPASGNSPVIFKCTTDSSLADTSSAVSRVASLTGKKFSFTIIKEKPKVGQ